MSEKKHDGKLKVVKPFTTVVNKPLFDERPVNLDGFKLSQYAAKPTGKPTIKQYQIALEFAGAAQEASGYWIGDLVSYGESRQDWHEKLSQAISVTGLAEGTLHNLGSMARRVEHDERVLSPSVAHSIVAAKLDKAGQRKWLKKARTEGWTSRELYVEVERSKIRRITEGQAEMAGMFRTWLVDCPWLYGNRQPSGSGAISHYPPMTIEQLCAMGPMVQAHCAKQAVGFFWVTAPMLYESPGPNDVIRAWGFEPKTGMVWDKVLGTVGHYVWDEHEHLIIATRGSCLPDRPTPMVKSIIHARKSDEHSEKPIEARQAIERMYDGPYIELFARERVDGWTCYGNQILEEIAEPKKKARA